MADKTLQERNQQVLTNITQLQSHEKKLYTRLDDVSLSKEEKQMIISKINEISQMRLNLYTGLKDMYSDYQSNVSSSTNTLNQSMAAIKVLEEELNQSKLKINAVEAEKDNKLRLVEINTYYGKRYSAHARLMKTIVFLCIPVILLAVLFNRGFLPENIYKLLIAILLVVGAVLIGLQLIDMSNRDNMNWDEYNWYFNQDQAPAGDDAVDESGGSSSSESDPWSTETATCVGSACCYDGSTYDSVSNRCVPNALATTTTAETTEEEVESFRGMDKYGYLQIKG